MVDVDDLEYALSGDIRDTWVLFSTTNICKLTSTPCPILSNTVVTYFLSMPINKLYPAVSDITSYNVFVSHSNAVCRF